MDRMIPLAILFCLTQLFYLARSQGKQADPQSPRKSLSSQPQLPNENVVIRVLSDGTNDPDDSSLSCYSCDYEIDGKWCKEPANRTLFSMARCPNKDDICQVWHFYSTNQDENNGRGVTYYFTRGCSETCQPGCTALDDMEHRFVSCFSCCTDKLCNIDSKAPSSSFSAYLIASVVIFWFLRTMR